MKEILQYITKEKLEGYKKGLKSGQTVIIYADDYRKIKLVKRGRKIYTVVVKYGENDILDIANNLLIKAS